MEPFENKKIEFPVTVNFRIIAEPLQDIRSHLLAALSELKVDAPLRFGQHSSTGRYVSFHIDVRVESYEIMREIDARLRSVNGVKMVF